MRLKNKKDNHNSHKAGLSAQRFAPGVLLFVFFASVLSFSAVGQDTTYIMYAFYGELINDSVVKLWMPEVSDGYKGYFERRRSSEGNIWQIISSEETRRFTEPYYDTFYYSCKDTLTYRYILTTLHDGGISKSREQQFTVGDVEIPDMPENSVFSVNVNTNQNLSFSFSPSQSDDVMGYVICKGNPCVALDTLWGKENTDYSCLSCSSEEINELAVMSFDSCMNTSLRSNKLNNIVLRAKRENCSGIVKLSWNEYKYMPSGLNNYEIHLINADGESIIQITPYLNSSLDITPYGNEIEMYVRAVGNSDIFFANSNKITLNQMTADTLDYIRMKNASVNIDNRTCTIETEVDNSKVVDSYSLFRSKDNEEFKFVKKIPYNGNQVIEIIDELSEEASGHIYSYYLQAPDLCGNSFTRSNIISTMKTNVEEVNIRTNRITWTSCSIFPVEKYEIYRYEQSDAFPVFVGESSVNMFEDHHSGEPSSADKLFYFVTAIERNNTQNTEVRTSNSSHNYIKHQTLFFIPNAFDPTEGMITKIQNFKPEVSYIKKESYDFKIYNRWGGLVFSTNNTEEGWNGTYKGELCDKGIYVYKIQFKNSDGKMEKHSGTFMLYD